MKTFQSLIKESFVSDLTRLSPQKLSTITKEKIIAAKFLELKDGSDAVYGVAIHDYMEGEYFATKMTIQAFLHGKYKFDSQSAPEKEFGDDKQAAIKFVKSMK